MSAERDFLEAKVKRGRSKQEGMVANLQILRRQLLESNIKPKVGQIRLKDLDDDWSDSEDQASQNQTKGYVCLLTLKNAWRSVLQTFYKAMWS